MRSDKNEYFQDFCFFFCIPIDLSSLLVQASSKIEQDLCRFIFFFGEHIVLLGIFHTKKIVCGANEPYLADILSPRFLRISLRFINRLLVDMIILA